MHIWALGYWIKYMAYSFVKVSPKAAVHNIQSTALNTSPLNTSTRLLLGCNNIVIVVTTLLQPGNNLVNVLSGDILSAIYCINAKPYSFCL